MTRHRAITGRSTRQRALIAGGSIATGVAASAALWPSINGLADQSPPVPRNVNLAEYPITATDNTTVYARDAALTLTTSTDKQIVSPGTPITFTYTVVNSGGVAFTDIRVVDDKCSPITGPAGNDADPLLNVNETWRFSCTTDVLADETHKASVTGTPVLPTGAPAPASSSPAPAPSGTTAPPAAGTLADGVYTGPVVPVNVPGEGLTGSIQVVATVSGGRLASIAIPSCPTVGATSVSICKYQVATTAALNNDPSAPTMIYQAIQGQSANAVTVASTSGATYTGAAFKSSLQAALTAAAA
jgi:uncharacterized protein with FMN-binding domain